MSSKLDRWQAAVEKFDLIDGSSSPKEAIDIARRYRLACLEALPPLLEIARLAAGARLGKWSQADVNRLDALLREVTEDD